MQNLYQLTLMNNSDSPTLSDSLAQTTLKSQRLSGANSYIKFYVKHYDGITYCNNIENSYRMSGFNVVVTLQNNHKNTFAL